MVRWRSCVITADDVAVVAAFWEAATGLGRALDMPDEVVLTPNGDAESYPGLVIVAGKPETSSAVHLDLNADDLDADVHRLTTLGATLVSAPGDGWKMLTDPEGNPFCLRRVG